MQQFFIKQLPYFFFLFRRLYESLFFEKTQGTKIHRLFCRRVWMKSAISITLILKTFSHNFYLIQLCIIIVTSGLQLHNQCTSRSISTIRGLYQCLEETLGLLCHYTNFSVSIFQDLCNQINCLSSFRINILLV